MFDFGVWIHRGLSQEDQVWSSGLVKQVWGAVAFCRGLGELAVAGQGADYGSVPAALLQNTLGLNRLIVIVIATHELDWPALLVTVWTFCSPPGWGPHHGPKARLDTNNSHHPTLVNSYLRWDELPPGPLPPPSPEMPRCRLSGWCLDSSGSNY